jgi:photosystem II stability/assembly factor-like uncharacterized protein
VQLARIVVLALVLTMSGAAQARTSRVAVPTSIAFWDRNHGLASFVVYGPTDRSEGYVASTGDGGKTWSIRWRGVAALHVAVISGTDAAWAVIQPRRACSPCSTLIMRTKDRGHTWTRVGLAPRSIPSFPTTRVGFAMQSRDTNAGPLIRTTDGGRTWRRVGAPCRKGWGGFASSAAVSFVSPSRGWLMCKGRPGSRSQSKALYSTRNGGRSWKRLLNAHFEPARIRLGGLQASGHVEGMAFERTGHGLLWSTNGDTLRTSDGGRHWRPLATTAPDVREAYSGWLVDDRIGFLLLQDGAQEHWELLRTGNGGRTWRVVRFWSRR